MKKKTLPYVDTLDKAKEAVKQVNACAEEFKTKPLIFITLVNKELSDEITKANASVFDLFNTFLVPLEQELNAKSSFTVGRSHGVVNPESYNHRIDAVNYALSHDDGVKIKCMFFLRLEDERISRVLFR